jgi:hypothetical protein
MKGRDRVRASSGTSRKNPTPGASVRSWPNDQPDTAHREPGLGQSSNARRPASVIQTRSTFIFGSNAPVVLNRR